MKNEPSGGLPDGFYEWTWQWVDTFFQADRYVDIHPKHQTSFTMPKCLKEDRVNLFALHSGTVTTPGAFVIAIPGGRFCGDGSLGAVISQDNKLIHDVSRSGETEPGLHWIFQQEMLPELKSIPGNAAYLDTMPTWHNNYFHWMFDVVAKFDLLNRSGIEIDRYILNPRSYPYQFETLRYLGIPEEKIIENNKGLHIQADQLVLASQPTMLPEWACQFVRNVMKEQNGIDRNPAYKKVYISRSQAAHRNVVNEKEVTEVLKQQGFTIVELEQLDVLKQVEIFSSAKVIVAPHGAGLANLVFARPGTTLIELFSPAYIHPLYWVLSNRIGVDYYYLVGKGRRLAEEYYQEWPTCGGDEDIKVSVRKLLKVLRSAGY